MGSRSSATVPISFNGAIMISGLYALTSLFSVADDPA